MEVTNEFLNQLRIIYNKQKQDNVSIDIISESISEIVAARPRTVGDRVAISNFVLNLFSEQERIFYVKNY